MQPNEVTPDIEMAMWLAAEPAPRQPGVTPAIETPPRPGRIGTSPLLLLCLDLVSVLSAFLLVELSAGDTRATLNPAGIGLPAVAALVLVGCVAERGGYEDFTRPVAKSLFPLFLAWLQAVGLTALLMLILGLVSDMLASDMFDITAGRARPVLFLLAGFPALVATRLVLHRFAPARRAIVVGTNRVSRAVIERFRRTASGTVRVVGLVSDEAWPRDPTFCALPVLGGLSELRPLVRTKQIDMVVLAQPCAQHLRLGPLVEQLSAEGVDVVVVPDLADLTGRDCKMVSQAGLPFLQFAPPPLTAWQRGAKRALDVVLGLMLFALVLPGMALIAILIKMDTPGPVLFRQPRRGLHNETFTLLKFRTMHEHLTDLGAARQTGRNDRRVTRVGRWLRRSSLDELPQLLNVLGGSMSLVGPRPHALDMTVVGLSLDAAVPSYFSRYRVRPGITGLAQVSGVRGEVDCVEKLRRRVHYDIAYIENWSLWMDLRILWRTARVVLFDPNAY